MKFSEVSKFTGTFFPLNSYQQPGLCTTLWLLFLCGDVDNKGMTIKLDMIILSLETPVAFNCSGAEWEISSDNKHNIVSPLITVMFVDFESSFYWSVKSSIR